MKKGLLFAMLAMMITVSGCTMPRNKEKAGHGAAGEFDMLDTFQAEKPADSEAMILCLKDKDVTFYGGASCGYSCDRVAAEGKDMKNFSCIDCDENDGLCDAIGIEQLPAWINPDDGQTEYDITELTELAKAFDCYE